MPGTSLLCRQDDKFLASAYSIGPCILCIFLLVGMFSFDSYREATILNIQKSIIDPINIGLVLEKFEFDRAIAAIWERIGHNDALITIKKPFSCIKSDDAQVKEEAVLILKKLVRELYAIAIDLEPFMPATSKTIIDAVIANKKPENLFPRLAEASREGGPRKE